MMKQQTKKEESSMGQINSGACGSKIFEKIDQRRG